MTTLILLGAAAIALAKNLDETTTAAPAGSTLVAHVSDSVVRVDGDAEVDETTSTKDAVRTRARSRERGDGHRCGKFAIPVRKPLERKVLPDATNVAEAEREASAESTEAKAKIAERVKELEEHKTQRSGEEDSERVAEKVRDAAERIREVTAKVCELATKGKVEGGTATTTDGRFKELESEIMRIVARPDPTPSATPATRKRDGGSGKSEDSEESGERPKLDKAPLERPPTMVNADGLRAHCGKVATEQAARDAAAQMQRAAVGDILNREKIAEATRASLRSEFTREGTRTERSEGTRTERSEGTRTFTSRSEGTRSEGTRTEGTRTEGTRTEGTRTEGTRSEGTRTEGTRSLTSRSEGTRIEVTRSEGTHESRTPEPTKASSGRKRDGDTTTVAGAAAADDDDDDDFESPELRGAVRDEVAKHIETVAALCAVEPDAAPANADAATVTAAAAVRSAFKMLCDKVKDTCGKSADDFERGGEIEASEKVVEARKEKAEFDEVKATGVRDAAAKCAAKLATGNVGVANKELKDAKEKCKAVLDSCGKKLDVAKSSGGKLSDKVKAAENEGKTRDRVPLNESDLTAAGVTDEEKKTLADCKDKIEAARAKVAEGVRNLGDSWKSECGDKLSFERKCIKKAERRVCMTVENAVSASADAVEEVKAVRDAFVAKFHERCGALPASAAEVAASAVQKECETHRESAENAVVEKKTDEKPRSTKTVGGKQVRDARACVSLPVVPPSTAANPATSGQRRRDAAATEAFVTKMLTDPSSKTAVCSEVASVTEPVPASVPVVSTSNAVDEPLAIDAISLSIKAQESGASTLAVSALAAVSTIVALFFF